MESKIVHKKEVGDGGKKCKILKEVKSIEKRNKNPQSFLEISLLQKEVSLHINCKVMQWVTYWLKTVNYFHKMFNLRYLTWFGAMIDI